MIKQVQKNKPVSKSFLLKVKKSKTGKGLYANEIIPKGSRILEYIGNPVKPEDQNKINSKYLFETGRGLMINGNVPENTARYINHSCKPNCEANGPRGKVFIIAIRKINKGEELTYDYGMEYFDEIIKSKGCRCKGCHK